MPSVDDKLQSLRAALFSDQRKGGALLLVYPPSDEREFRRKYDEVIQELAVRNIETAVVDFRLLVFESLEARGLLEKAFKLDAEGDRGAAQTLARITQKEAEARVLKAAEQSPQAVILCKNTAALFPWMSYSALLERVENVVKNTLVIPFPGTEAGPALHFLGVKDGYNYRAARI
jgi:hypothetical protein